MTLFHPARGKVRVKGVPGTPNKVLHAWLQQQLEDILNRLPPDSGLPADHEVWSQWQQGLSVRITLPQEPERLRMLLVMDNLAGHHTPSFVCWLYDHGVMPLYTPVGGSWLNLGESMQHILVQRALAGQDLRTPKEIINNLEQAARAWNRNPTPFTWVVGGTSGDKGHGSACIGWPHQEHASFGRCGAHEQLWLNGNGRGERPTTGCQSCSWWTPRGCTRRASCFTRRRTGCGSRPKCRRLSSGAAGNAASHGDMPPCLPQAPAATCAGTGRLGGGGRAVDRSGIGMALDHRREGTAHMGPTAVQTQRRGSVSDRGATHWQLLTAVRQYRATRK
jgi:hypothetical protein